MLARASRRAPAFREFESSLQAAAALLLCLSAVQSLGARLPRLHRNVTGT